MLVNTNASSVNNTRKMIGFSSDIRSATEGRADWNTENANFQVMADNLQREKIMEIREPKGRKFELPETVDYFWRPGRERPTLYSRPVAAGVRPAGAAPGPL